MTLRSYTIINHNYTSRILSPTRLIHQFFAIVKIVTVIIPSVNSVSFESDLTFQDGGDNCR